jgi:S1-C subfamily serine protease
MRDKVLFLMFAIIVSFPAFAQKQEKIYYDKIWNVCSASEAEYYRLITLDANGKSVGKVRDYYITGELQWEGSFSYFSRTGDKKSICEGVCIWYYKNGKKESEVTFVHGKMEGILLSWYESGKKRSEQEYKNDKRNGASLFWHENGKLYRKYLFIDDKLDGKFFIECDEFDKCQNIFYENFYNNDNHWTIADKSEYSIKLVEEEGLLLNNKNNSALKSTINIPLDLSANFSIETIVDFKDGITNNGHGIVWGCKDWDNYNTFEISANGQYTIRGETEGIHIPVKQWTETSIINKNQQRNSLKILRLSDKIYYSINGQLVYSSDFYGFRGNWIGFYIAGGNQKVLFENLIVKQDISENNYPIINSNNSTSDWESSGSGFFIDYRGYIVTNYHVVEEAKEIEVEFIRNGQKQIFKAEIIQSDRQNDLAVIKISDNSFKPFTHLSYNFKTSISDVGANVFALGYPLTQIMGGEVKFTDGKISSKTGFQGDVTNYQITVPIQPGSSGGPLFDYDGNLVGIASAGLRKDIADNVSYAVKSSYLKNLLDVLPVTIKLPTTCQLQITP